MKKSIIFFSLFIMGCTSTKSYVKEQPQPIHENNGIVLDELILNPTANFENIQELAYNNSTEKKILELKISSYTNKSNSSKERISSGLSLLKNSTSVSGALGFLSKIISGKNKKENLEILKTRLEKVKIDLSQKLAKEIQELVKVRKEINELESLVKENQTKEKINRYFENLGFAKSENNENAEKTKKLFDKAVYREADIERNIFEFCGLIKI